MRTTSSVESFNALLNLSIDKHPEFFKLVMALKIHDSRKTDEMFYVANNNPVPDAYFEKKKKKDQERDQKIRSLTDKLEANELDTEAFMRAMAKDENGEYPSIHSFLHYPLTENIFIKTRLFIFVLFL